MPSAKYDVPSSMTGHWAEKAAGITRRDAVKAAGKALASVAGLAALSSLPGGELSSAAEAPSPQTTRAGQPSQRAKPTEKLRIATCQFPVSADTAARCEAGPRFHASGGKRGSAPAAHVRG